MSDSRPIDATDNNNKGRVIIDWAQVPDDDIRYDTDDEEEARLEAERVAREQAEAERAARERAEAKRAEREAEEKRVHEEEEKREAEHKRKAEAGKSDEAGAGGASGEAGGEVKRVVMDPGCTHCTRAQVVCEFLVDGNKKWVACICCNLSKGKCQWPRDGKDIKAGPKAIGKADKGKKQKVDDENAEAGPSNQKWAKTSTRPVKVLDLDEAEAGGSRSWEAGAECYSGLEEKLEWLIDVVGLIANNLAGLFEAHEAMAENSGRIANVLEAMLDESYSFRMVVSPSDSGSSELDSDELHEEAEWLKTHGKDEEEESGGEDESMAEAK
ncbi:hypothetical protein M404DRAFT_26569 [Pisolithus tinctorius Marx 270]|uniref:Uncharacterized protein n=1 Tax=Pisolithus tinctorius Marx 270 TaxID=870435 RepID=A0A0C3J4E5_PISTI|nr:hypothetical protein M404DRAFT_26569 [Pisolithus tinctorius Marx 270]